MKNLTESCDFFVVQNRERGHVAGFGQDHVAAALADFLPAVLGEGVDDLAATQGG